MVLVYLHYIVRLITITLKSGTPRYFKWPYQAKVMKMLEIVSRIMVVIGAGPLSPRCPFLPTTVFHVVSCLDRPGHEVYSMANEKRNTPGIRR